MAVRLNNNAYYDISFIKEKNSEFGKKCVNSSKIIDNYNIPRDDWVYVSYSKNKGYSVLPYDTLYRQKRLFISCSWVDANVHPFCQKSIERDTHAQQEIDIHDYLLQVKQKQFLCQESYHYVYIVTSPIIPIVKVGIWGNDIYRLASRYMCVYGNNIELYVFTVNNEYEKKTLEKEFISHFKENKLCRELFEKKDFESYKNFLQKRTMKNGVQWDREKGRMDRKRYITKPYPPLPRLINKKTDFVFDNIHYQLQVRGTGYSDTTFFKASDIGVICKIQVRYITKYERGIDYVMFKNTDIYGNKDNKSNNDVSMYMTPCGIYKLLGRIHNRSNISNALIMWVSQIVM